MIVPILGSTTKTVIMIHDTVNSSLQFYIGTKDAESRLCYNKDLSFKLVHILSGCGVHHVNTTQMDFCAGDVFIVAPGEEMNCVDTHETTTYFMVRFTSLFLEVTSRGVESNVDFIRLLQHANTNLKYTCSLNRDNSVLTQLLGALLAETSEGRNASRHYIRQLFFTILLIVADSIKTATLGDLSAANDQKTVEMLHYININIFYPERLTTNALSRKFCISPAYLGKYFKNNTGRNLHQYILEYKIKLIESRLTNSNMRIKEIADEFGFADKSYLSRFFVKCNGISPLAFRKTKISA